ncbi:MAG: hypothetical protein JW976_11390 [Syntrophaceae bacterium]|nr:hypothetical protein [Syntrophaceae bacterium]
MTKPGDMDDTAFYHAATGATGGGETLNIKKIPIALSQASLGSHFKYYRH